jgi:hypothetical protein
MVAGFDIAGDVWCSIIKFGRADSIMITMMVMVFRNLFTRDIFWCGVGLA